MEPPHPTHDARCLLILAGGVLEWRIEDQARRIAEKRGAAQIEPDDVRAATTHVLREDLSQIPHLIEQELDGYTARKRSAA